MKCPSCSLAKSPKPRRPWPQSTIPTGAHSLGGSDQGPQVFMQRVSFGTSMTMITSKRYPQYRLGQGDAKRQLDQDCCYVGSMAVARFVSTCGESHSRAAHSHRPADCHTLLYYLRLSPLTETFHGTKTATNAGRSAYVAACTWTLESHWRLNLV